MRQCAAVITKFGVTNAPPQKAVQIKPPRNLFRNAICNTKSALRINLISHVSNFLNNLSAREGSSHLVSKHTPSNYY